MTRRTHLLAGAVLAAPAVQVVPMFLHPHVEEVGFAAAVAADPSGWRLIHLGAAVAAMLYVVALPALAALPHRRGAALATVGAVLGVVGSTALALGFSAEAFVLPLGIEAGLAGEQLDTLAEAAESGLAGTLLLVGLPASGLGQLLLAGGLLRSRQVAWWKPALVLAGLLGSLFAPPGSTAGPLVMLVAVAGYASLVADVARSRRVAIGAAATVPALNPVG